MADKKFIGKCSLGKYPDQVEIGLTRDHIQALNEAIDSSTTGWINLRINKGKDSGKPYCELLEVK